MLLGNYSPFNRLPLTFRSGTLTAGANQAFSPANYGKCGWSPMVWQDGASQGSPEIGYPSGYYSRGFKLPLGKSSSTTKRQFLSGLSAVMTFGGTAIGAKGRPAVGSSTLVINSSGQAKLIVAGIGSALFTINATSDVFGRLLAEGNATLTIIAEGDTLEGLGFQSGTSAIIIDSSALPRGIGWIDGTTGFTTDLTTQLIADAVWDAIAVDNNDVGTMGQKLNSAAVGGIDYDTLADAVWDEALSGHVTADTYGKFIQKLLTVSKFLGLK